MCKFDGKSNKKPRTDQLRNAKEEHGFLDISSKEGKIVCVVKIDDNKIKVYYE